MEELAWWIPPLIFVARICDVSLGTLRTITVINGQRLLSGVLGFVEVIIWVLAVGNAIRFLSSPVALVAYAGGFSMGTMVGMTIESRIAMGYRMLRIVSSDPKVSVSQRMRERGYRVTTVDGTGRDGPVEIAFSVVRRRLLKDALRVIEEIAPDAFVTVERTDRASGGAFASNGRVTRRFTGLAGVLRK